jgi:hypothetical protein
MAKKNKDGKNNPQIKNNNVKNPSEPSTPSIGNKFHDRLVKFFLQNIIIFRIFLKTILEPKIFNTIDIDSLESYPHYVITEQLKQLEPDLCFIGNLKQCQANNKISTSEQIPPDLILIIEHATDTDKYMSLRMLHYAENLFYDYCSNVIIPNKTINDPVFPRVFCLIIHQGKEWENLKSVHELSAHLTNKKIEKNFAHQVSVLNLSNIDFKKLKAGPECELLLFLLQ